VAAIVFWLGGGLDSDYTRQELRSREFTRAGHAFPDPYTFQLWLRLSPAERATHPLLASVDPRRASIYAGTGDPSDAGLLRRLGERAGKALRFYPLEAIGLGTFGGPLVLALALLGAFVRWRRHQDVLLLRGLCAGGAVFLAFHAWFGTSNESHLVIFAAPLAVAAACGVAEVARAVATSSGRRTTILVVIVGALVVHEAMAARIAMSRLYHGAGAARYGTADAFRVAREVARLPADAGCVLVGGRPEDALAITWVADRPALVLAPATLRHLTAAGELGELLSAHGVGALTGYDASLLTQPEVARAISGLWQVSPSR
jgi:hypothetical protein